MAPKNTYYEQFKDLADAWDAFKRAVLDEVIRAWRWVFRKKGNPHES